MYRKYCMCHISEMNDDIDNMNLKTHVASLTMKEMKEHLTD